MKPKLTGLLLTLLIPLGLSSPAWAGHHEKEEASDPLAAAAEFPLTMRRTTLIVRDIEASLKLYRDGLGMEVIYDEEINRPHSSEDREQRLRLIFLKASHDYVGVIGLIDYEYGYPDHPAHTKPVRREGFTWRIKALVRHAPRATNVATHAAKLLRALHEGLRRTPTPRPVLPAARRGRHARRGHL